VDLLATWPDSLWAFLASCLLCFGLPSASLLLVFGRVGRCRECWWICRALPVTGLLLVGASGFWVSPAVWLGLPCVEFGAAVVRCDPRRCESGREGGSGAVVEDGSVGGAVFGLLGAWLSGHSGHRRWCCWGCAWSATSALAASFLSTREMMALACVVVMAMLGATVRVMAEEQKGVGVQGLGAIVAFESLVLVLVCTALCLGPV